ncbi:MAG TPA: helix-turn-helix domain-containing protein [Anaeromyxobacteraceae bacterium]|nr:helix-turn-helix domain-containing protein [Anaeromyxobacteraceae bacterium]
MSDKVWTTKDVAEFLKASERWVRNAVAGGRLPYTRLGGLLRFDPEKIRAIATRDEAPARVLRRSSDSGIPGE